MERTDDEQVFFPGLAVEPSPAQSQPIADSPTSKTPNDALWFWYLCFAPRCFFAHFATKPLPLLTALCAWIYGMAGVIDRIEMRHLQGRLPVDQIGMTRGWGSYLAIVLLGGVLAGLVYYGIGGWWYRQRLKWCGVPQADPSLARRVYLYASQVLALPVVLITFGQATAFDTPVQMMDADGPWVVPLAAAIAVLAIWSVWTSYRGADTVFNMPRRGMAATWFLVLPGLVYVTIFAALFAAGALMAQDPITQPPDLEHPKAYRGTSVRFGYPGNWAVGQSGTDPERDFRIHVRPDQDGVLVVEIYESTVLPEEELALIVSDMRDHLSGWREEYLASRWGKMRGVGVRAVADNEEDAYRITVLVVPLAPGRYMTIRQMCAVTHEPLAQPGFELIQSSFKISRRLLK